MRNMHKKHSREDWETRKLGATESFVRKVSSTREKALDNKMGLQVISIRLQKGLIEDLTELAIQDGLGYQPYMRQVLTQHVRNEKRNRNKHLRVVSR